MRVWGSRSGRGDEQRHITVQSRRGLKGLSYRRRVSTMVSTHSSRGSTRGVSVGIALHGVRTCSQTPGRPPSSDRITIQSEQSDI